MIEAKISLLVGLFAGFLSSRVVQGTTYSYTGAVQTYIVPEDDVEITATVCGASGGSCYSTGSKVPGYGGCITSALTGLTKGMILYVYVGGAGSAATSDGSGGGYNGGGQAAVYRGSAKGGGGGGGSDIRTSSSLYDRIVVGGGGGGCGYANSGGVGGGLEGGDARNGSPGGGYGGTQTAGGATYVDGTGEAGSFGYGGDAFLTDCNGGGGGGWYGGGGGGEGSTRYGGGGGSSYSCYDITSNLQDVQTGDGLITITPDSCDNCTTTSRAYASSSCSYQTMGVPTTKPTLSPTTSEEREFLTFSDMHIDPACTSVEYLGYTSTSTDEDCLDLCLNNTLCNYAVWRPSDLWCHQCNLNRTDPVVSAAAADGVTMTSYCFSCSVSYDNDHGSSSDSEGAPVGAIIVGVVGFLFFLLSMYCTYIRKKIKVNDAVPATATVQPYVPIAAAAQKDNTTMYVGQFLDANANRMVYDPSGMEMGSKPTYTYTTTTTVTTTTTTTTGLGNNVMYLS